MTYNLSSLSWRRIHYDAIVKALELTNGNCAICGEPIFDLLTADLDDGKAIHWTCKGVTKCR